MPSCENAIFYAIRRFPFNSYLNSQNKYKALQQNNYLIVPEPIKT